VTDDPPLLEAPPTGRGSRRATFRFYGELNDFLAPGRRGRELPYRFDGTPSVKDAIEAQRVVHPEVALIVAGGELVGFEHHLRDGERVAVYPAFKTLAVSSPVALRAPPERPCRFAVDVNLGKLARWLRLLGFDTAWRNDFTDPELARLAADERRILLTRDRRLLHYRQISHGRWIRAVDPERQVAEVLRHFRLADAVAPFRRCLICNGTVHPVPKQRILHAIPPKTRRYYDEFHQCERCGRIYWKGPHFRRLEATLARLRR
jgi:hypothetical protein